MNNNRTPQFTASKGEAGLSLVELLVGIAIGLMVVLAATGTLVLNRSSSNTIFRHSRDHRTGIQCLETNGLPVASIRGAMESTATPDTAALPAAQQTFDLATLVQRRLEPLSHTPVTGTITGIITGRNNLTASGLTYDELTFVFSSRGAAVSRDCLGNQAAAMNADLPNRFFLQADNPGAAVSETNRPNLMCQGLSANPAQPSRTQCGRPANSVPGGSRCDPAMAQRCASTGRRSVEPKSQP
jgi:type IV pilus assembly protein PilW